MDVPTISLDRLEQLSRQEDEPLYLTSTDKMVVPPNPLDKPKRTLQVDKPRELNSIEKNKSLSILKVETKCGFSPLKRRNL